MKFEFGFQISMIRSIIKRERILPKKDNADMVKEFWAISLINSICKILVKVLVNCLKKVLLLEDKFWIRLLLLMK